MAPITEEQKAIIKATVPILETGGEALTKHFYKMMLSEYEEVRPLFNQAHQQSGDQPRALANAVLMYARHIDQLEKLGNLVGQIIHKHVALQVLPEHYPIVGTCLLRAIREVLGPEIATDEVIAAWGVAYQQLADILIQKEEVVYQTLETKEGGWRGARKFKVARKEKESEEITSFYFEPVDGSEVVSYLPGQYLGLRLMLEGGEVRRNYSVSDSPNGKYYRISVKREPNGKVSNFLHDNVEVGFEIDLFPPTGDFVLRESTKPVVFITAGVGITPSISMLEKALQENREVSYIHCARNGRVHAFRDFIDKAVEGKSNVKKFYCYSEPDEGDVHVDAKGMLTKEKLVEWFPKNLDVDVYFLGPKPFMAMMKKYMRELGIPETQVFYEFFGPAAQLEVKEE